WADGAERIPDELATAGFWETFAPAGRLPRAGDQWRSPAHAATLHKLAETRSAALYQGELAEQILRFSRRTGGLLSEDDLVNHRNEWVVPLSVRYRGHEVWELPPNGQGIATLLALNIV